jgi:hypothetical protein
MYLHWSKNLAIGLLVGFSLLMVLLWSVRGAETSSVLKPHTTTWIILNYAGLVLWLIVWVGDQARMRNNALWPWLIPLLIAPLPTLTLFLLYTLKRS